MLRMSRELFEQVVADALDGLPEEIAAAMENVAVVVEERYSKLFALEHVRPSVVADVHVRYVSSLLARETFRVGVRVVKIGTSSVTFGYRVEAGDGRVVAEADSVEVMVDPETRRPRALSNEARAALGAA